MKSKTETDKFITIGIPAYKAQDHISDLLSSIRIQTMVNNISVIIADDMPNDDGGYDEIITIFPDLDITVLATDKNSGPGLARQRVLDACKTPWITFCDADDILINPLAIEYLTQEIKQNVVVVQGAFMREIAKGQHPQGVRLTQQNDIGHPWVFGRLYYVPFLRYMGIGFSAQRTTEDPAFNWKIRMSIEDTPFQWDITETPIYMWRTGSGPRIGIKECCEEKEKGEDCPLYNYDLCQVGATAAEISAIKFCKKKNPFNESILKFTVQMMLEHYFTYIKCLERKPMLAEQNFFNAKRFYHAVYKQIEKDVTEDIIKDLYTVSRAQNSQDMLGIIPKITFFDFMKRIASEVYGGVDEFNDIRAELPEWVIELDKKSGVLGDEGYIYYEGEDTDYVMKELYKEYKDAKKLRPVSDLKNKYRLIRGESIHSQQDLADLCVGFTERR